jgi:3-mercaptopyruvate sulfurtransferase SseA
MLTRRLLPAVVTMLLAVAIGAVAQEAEEDTSSPKLRIEWAEFKKLYDAKKVEVIDVRGDPSFEAGHIPGSRSIPLEQIEKQARALRKIKKPIVLYCA